MIIHQGLSKVTALIEGSLDKDDSMRVSRSRVHGERKGRIACNKYRLRAVAPFSLSHFCTLFLATAKVSSNEYQERFMALHFSRSRTRLLRIFRKALIYPQTESFVAAEEEGIFLEDLTTPLRYAKPTRSEHLICLSRDGKTIPLPL